MNVSYTSEYHSQYYIENKEKYQKYYKDYYKNNPPKRDFCEVCQKNYIDIQKHFKSKIHNKKLE